MFIGQCRQKTLGQAGKCIYIYGKLLIQYLEWLLHNFSETSHFTDHAKKQLGKSLLQHANFMVTEFRIEFIEDY